MKPQLMVTVERKFQKRFLNPADQKRAVFFDEHHRLAKDEFHKGARAVIEHFIKVKLNLPPPPPHVKKSINQAQLENGKYKKSVAHLAKEIKMNGLEIPV